MIFSVLWEEEAEEFCVVTSGIVQKMPAFTYTGEKHLTILVKGLVTKKIYIVQVYGNQ